MIGSNTMGTELDVTGTSTQSVHITANTTEKGNNEAISKIRLIEVAAPLNGTGTGTATVVWSASPGTTTYDYTFNQIVKENYFYRVEVESSTYHAYSNPIWIK